MVQSAPIKPDSPLTAEWLNGLLAGLERAKLTCDSSSGLQLSTGSTGRSLSFIPDPGMWVKITAVGALGDYAWKEQIPVSGGSWSDGPTLGTTSVDPAHEASDMTSVPVNTIVWASRAKSTRKLLFRASQCTGGGQISRTILGCNNLPLEGVTVTATRAGSNYTAVTDAGGIAVISVVGNGTYTMAVSGVSARFGNQAIAATIFSGASVSGSSVLVPTSSYKCAGWTDGAGAGPCVLPFSTTLYMTDSIYPGTRTLTYGGPGLWSGGTAVNFPGCNGCAAFPGITVSYNIGTGAGNRVVSTGWTRQLQPAGYSCPDNGGSSQTLRFGTTTSLTCPPAGMRLTAVGDPESADVNNRSPYCTPPTYTITETPP